MIRAIMNNIRLLQQKLKIDISFCPDSQTIQDQSSQGQRQTLSCQYFNFVLFYNFFAQNVMARSHQCLCRYCLLLYFKICIGTQTYSHLVETEAAISKASPGMEQYKTTNKHSSSKTVKGGYRVRERDRQEEGKQQVTVLSLLAAVSCSFAAPVFHVRLYM